MSIKPGTHQFAELEPAIGLTSSVTQDPLTPVEMGTAANNTAYETTDSNGGSIPDQTPVVPDPPDPPEEPDAP